MRNSTRIPVSQTAPAGLPGGTPFPMVQASSSKGGGLTALRHVPAHGATETTSQARGGAQSMPGDHSPEDGTPWWVAAVLLVIFGVAMFLSGMLVGFHLN